MTIKLGSNSFSNIKLGSSQVNSIYLGNNLVWTNSIPASLLLHFDGDFSDSSASASSVTQYETTISTSEKVFGSGSAQFDGTASYIESDANVNFSSSDDFTVECWVKFSSASGYLPLIRLPYGWVFYIYTNEGASSLYWGVPEVSNDLSGSFSPVNDVWYHVAAARNSGTLRLFVNGVKIAEASNTNSYSSPSANYVNIGTYVNTYLNGYIDDLRIVKGLGVYTNAFDPPTAPLSANATVAPPAMGGNLLMHFDNDFSVTGRDVAVFGDAQISNIQSRFGGGSASFDGTGDYLQINKFSQWRPGVSGEPFTVEFWCYLNNINATQVLLCKHGGTQAWNGSTGLNFELYTNTNGTLSSVHYGLGGAIDMTSSGVLSLNQWDHIAYVFDGQNLGLFINGLADTSISTTFGTVSNANVLQISGEVADSFILNGYIDELRITQGVAIYTLGENFTVPNQPFSN